MNTRALDLRPGYDVALMCQPESRVLRPGTLCVLACVCVANVREAVAV